MTTQARLEICSKSNQEKDKLSKPRDMLNPSKKKTIQARQEICSTQSRKIKIKEDKRYVQPNQ